MCKKVLVCSAGIRAERISLCIAHVYVYWRKETRMYSHNEAISFFLAPTPPPSSFVHFEKKKYISIDIHEN